MMAALVTRIALIASVLVGFAGSAQALQFAELTLNNCDSMGCEGSTLYLSVQEEAGGTWLVTYTINTDDYTGDRTGFNQIGFKAIQGWTDGVVLSSPVGSITDWNPVYESPIRANHLCEDASNGNTDKVCVQGFVSDITVGGDYTWTFRISGGTLMDTDEWHLGAQYANGPWRSSGHIISAGAVPIPEPIGAMLFGLGAILVARRARRS
jgi:hypothetical protein